MEKLLLIAFGWALAQSSRIIELLFIKWRKRREVMIKLNYLLQRLVIQIELNPHLHEQGYIWSIAGMFELDDSYSRIPHPPPSIPEKFDTYAEAILEWEAQKGSLIISDKLGAVRSSLKRAEKFYELFSMYAEKKIEKEIPERSINIYEQTLKDSRKILLELLQQFQPKESIYARWRNKRYMKKFKKDVNETQATGKDTKQ